MLFGAHNERSAERHARLADETVTGSDGSISFWDKTNKTRLKSECKAPCHEP